MACIAEATFVRPLTNAFITHFITHYSLLVDVYLLVNVLRLLVLQMKRSFEDSFVRLFCFLLPLNSDLVV